MPKRDAIAAPAETGPSGTTCSDHAAGALERLRRAFDAAGRRARLLGTPVLAWATARIPSFDPLDLVQRTTSDDRMLWARPDDRQALAGAGSAWTFTASGEDRFAQIETAWMSVMEHAVGEPATGGRAGTRTRGSGAAPGPVAFFGFAFAPSGRAPGDAGSNTPVSAGWDADPWPGYPDALITIPRVVVGRSTGESWVIVSAMSDGHEPFPAQAYAHTLRCIASPRETRTPGTGEPAYHDQKGGDSEDSRLPRGLDLIGEFPPAEKWKASVQSTAGAVRTGRLRKAVLARGIRVRAGRLNPAAALRALRAGYPSCTTFAFGRDGRWFLGATPERLVSVRDGEAAVAAVAGTARRGRTAEEDRRFGAMLLASPKDRIEHAIVVEALREALGDTGTIIDHVAAPRLLTVRNAHHLHTPLRVTLRNRQTVLALAGRLHPTPAVGGTPLRDALRWIHQEEGWDRGWYAGPIGWISHEGDGEAAVAIRSALVHEAEALLFAGCGVVADSDPDQEYAESDLKLRPLASALAATAETGGRAPSPWSEGP